MKLFEGKSPAERNKIIAALVLGAMAVLALAYTFVLPSLVGRKVSVTVNVTPTPTVSPRRNAATAQLPSDAEVNFQYTTTPVNYEPGQFYAPDAGRNIFAFYEPPPPTPYVPTPPPTPKPTVFVTPEPPPIPPFSIGFVTPQSVYAGSKSFRMEVNGDKFTPDSLIFLNGSQLPTTFISPQKLVADVPSNFINGAGSLQIMVRTPDGGLYSNSVALNIQAPPTPQFQYIGMIARQRFNNDTAYFREQGKPEFNARLNDVIGGRFRLISISADKTIFEDKDLGFKHQLALYRPTTGQSSAAGNPSQNDFNNPGRFPNRGNMNPNPSNPNPPGIPYAVPQQGEIPGIPSSIPIYIPPTPQPNLKDEDDDGN